MDFENLVDQAQEEQAKYIIAPRFQKQNNKTGHCTECEEPISLARQAALPGADLCILCQEGKELNRKRFE